jgi:hypothetical protein
MSRVANGALVVAVVAVAVFHGCAAQNPVTVTNSTIQ